MKKLLFTLLACLSMGAMAQEGLILHYDFVGDEGTRPSWTWANPRRRATGNMWCTRRTTTRGDSYLKATIPHPVTGVVYDPERDGKPLTAPLGLMEHADKERRYTKLDMIYVKQ